jgi:hypothetical protein
LSFAAKPIRAGVVVLRPALDPKGGTMPIKLAIDARLLGQKRPLLADWAVTLPLDLSAQQAVLPLRDILTQVVLAEVVAFRERQEQRRLARIMGPGQIEAGVAAGKVDAAEHEFNQVVDADAAVATALQAFEDGLYFVFVEGAQVSSLDETITLRPELHLSFLRLVALAGG